MRLGVAGLAAAAVAIVGSFAIACIRAASGSRWAHRLALVATIVLVAAAGLAMLAALYLSALTCDESCDENSLPAFRSGDWWQTQDAWQWTGQLVAALAGLACLTLAMLLVAARRHRAAIVAVVLAAACFAAWAAFLAPLGDALGI